MIVFAVAAGVSVANLYYIQPLLHSVARDFGVSSTTAGLTVTVTQAGYVLGLVFVVPLGDMVRRKPLVLVMVGACFASLVLSGSSSTMPVLMAALVVVGLSSVVVQILIPFAATLAPEAERGTVVGRIMSGLLIGILLARTVSGFVAQFSSWRTIYIVASALMVLLAGFLAKNLPNLVASDPQPYGRLLSSTLQIATGDPVIRRRSLFGAASFCMLRLVQSSRSP